MQHDRHDDRRARVGAADAPVDPLTGRVLDGRYRIGPRIARGGMASVYEATDIRLDRTVAMKIMHPGLGDDTEFAERFVREARAAARLSHPNVVAVYDQGEDDGTVFLAMELVAGHTLRDVIRKESPMPPAKALALLEPVLAALAAAHRAGLIHRDIKPENVLIATDPTTGASRVKVADFGLAKAVSADTQHTATGGVLIGTVSYLAPELVVSGRADARADVYAAGVVLFELLTGAKPHEGETPIQVAYRHVHEDVPPPSSLVAGIPAYVDALVARATARERGLRPADAAVLLHQVHRVNHALAEGVTDDPELTADLTPLRVRLEAAEAPSAEDTTPDPLGGPFPGQMLATITPPPARSASRPMAEADPTTALPTAASVAPSDPRGDTGGDPSRPRRSRRGVLVLLVAVLLVLGGGGGAWWFLDGRYTTAPGVLGMTRDAASTELTSAGLAPEFAAEAYSETVPAGRVLSMDPTPGSKVLDGGTVSVTLSLGKERYDVPKVKGKAAADAREALTAAHLSVGKITKQWSDTVAAGVVIRSNPKAATTLRPSTAVALVVSKGPKPVQLRDWVGGSADQAKAWLADRGLTGKVVGEEHSNTIAKGGVISMDPSGGTTVHRGDEVSLVVSKGPELIEVPSVRGSGVDAAREKLEGLGFKVDTREAAGSLGLGFVFSQDPGAGEMVPLGTTITLSLI